ncbi:MAG TPA: 4Fe-4S dicluster domain-containing protein [Terracidiphilus sp.]|nr:4Fe-4S dicluster domain-containing protein [Terracidiphilus sp.]
MKILTMLWKNLLRGPETLRFPARPAVSAGYRGLVQFNPELCTGCALCKFRCTSRAIEYKAGKGEFTWSYDPGRCTFCGRCVEGCIEHAQKEGRTEHALTQEQACPPIYSTLGELKKTYTVARKPPAPRAAAPAASVGKQAEAAAGGNE